MKTPVGFLFSGVRSGIKPNRRDLALVFSETPCTAVGCFTANKAKAAPILHAQSRLPSSKIHAVIINSGNANALTGPVGVEDVQSVCAAAAKALQIPVDSVVSASTGVIGQR
ncbi:MAG TPA: bifunctional ornithine acetyltransferase/N-acetylglutamate synthase, partial [Myxococcales bacterium]